jgi:hypothetical protein
MSQFHIKEHVVRAQHSRERAAGAARGRENDLRLHVKQYIPHSNLDPKPGDVTIIGAQANGFPKECYEPFWEDLVQKLRERGKGVRGVWVADMYAQGRSGVVNEGMLGPDRESSSMLEGGREC